MPKEKRQDNAYHLRRVLEEMELDLVRNLRRNMQRHEQDEKYEGFRWEMWQKTKLRNLWKYRKENKEIAEQYSPEVKRIVCEALGDEYKCAENAFNHILSKLKALLQRRGVRYPKDISGRRMKPPPLEEDFFGVNKKRLEVLQEEAEKVLSREPQNPQESEPFRPEGKEKDLQGANNDKKLDEMIGKITNDLKGVQKAAWRSMDDVYRRVIYQAEINMAAGVKTLDQAIDMATKEFLDAGINCIEYRNGRRVNIASYAEMALRTASHRATLLGEGKKRDEWGIHTVVVSAHANTCPLCAPWQGKVLVDDVFCSGTSEEADRLGYPLLSTAIKAGLLHPNCRHTISTFFPGVSVVPRVPDTEKAIETYNAEQKQREFERKIRKWKRIAEGSMSPEKVNLANDKVRQYQEELRKHLKNRSELRRNYSREKTRGIPQKLSAKSVAKAGDDGIMKLSNKEVRDWYVHEASRIKETIDSSLPIEEQARKAFERRNEIRTKARDMMADEETRKSLDINRPNKTFEELIDSKMKRKGLSRDRAIRDIYETATKTNEDVNRMFRTGGEHNV